MICEASYVHMIQNMRNTSFMEEGCKSHTPKPTNNGKDDDSRDDKDRVVE